MSWNRPYWIRRRIWTARSRSALPTTDMSALGGSGISVEIKGKDLDTLQKIAGNVSALIEATEGTREVDDGLEETTDELRVSVKKEEAAKHNLTVGQVYQQIRSKLAEQSAVTSLSTDSDEYDVNVYDEAQKQYGREDIRKLTVTAAKPDGTTEEIPILELADFTDGKGLASITRGQPEPLSHGIGHGG